MLVLPSSLTHDTASACMQMLLQALQSDPGSVIEADASALTHFDSSALAVLLECRRASQGLGKGFVVRGLDPRLAGLSVLYGVNGLLPDTPVSAGASRAA